ncbi:fibrillin-3-like [Amphibalanus amphitrite]|uniref:fibrillin-3-like n=1 Tax=Amphibalanus amphitrite TaxID=1232801 RepID=UPI001C91EBAB|nr:fibrillin-3-like [Amphibalanus amphitrite]XP_043239061.1 fibrillin-3-like [Amphibalanus amphitrite]XP_043239062.1 fibrillin-3-like [Amphibalanus amphitrite]XP_043239064.1 fibrillin-3-like [Amphibalanus amphitrite]
MARIIRRWLVAVVLCLLAVAEGAVSKERLAARSWSALLDGPAAVDLTETGQVLPRFRPPGYGQARPWCPVGWRWNGRRCVDVDECRQANECRSPRVYCLNTLGSYRCLCRPGLVGDYYTVGCKTEEEYCQTRFRDAPTP